MEKIYLEPFLNKWISFSFSTDMKLFVDKVYNRVLEIIGNENASEIFYDLSDYYESKVKGLDTKKDYEKIYKTSSLCVIFYSERYLSGNNCNNECEVIKDMKINQGKINEYLLIQCVDIEDRNQFDWAKNKIKLFQKTNTIDDIAFQIVDKHKKLSGVDCFNPKVIIDYKEIREAFRNKDCMEKGKVFFDLLLSQRTYESYLKAKNTNKIILFEGPICTGKSTFLELLNSKYLKDDRVLILPKDLFFDALNQRRTELQYIKRLSERKKKVLSILYHLIIEQIKNKATDEELIQFVDVFEHTEIDFRIGNEKEILKKVIITLDDLYRKVSEYNNISILIPIDEIYHFPELQDVYFNLIHDFDQLNSEFGKDINIQIKLNSNVKYVISTTTLHGSPITGRDKIKNLNWFKTYLIEKKVVGSFLSLIEFDYDGIEKFKTIVFEKTNGHPWFLERFISLYLKSRIDLKSPLDPITLSLYIFNRSDFINAIMVKKLKDSIYFHKDENIKLTEKFFDEIENADKYDKEMFSSFSNYYDNPMLQLTGLLNYNYEFHERFNGRISIKSITNGFIKENLSRFKGYFGIEEKNI